MAQYHQQDPDWTYLGDFEYAGYEDDLYEDMDDREDDCNA